MRSSILTLCFAAAVVLGGCSRDNAPAAHTAAKPDTDSAVTAPPAEYDSLSYAEPDKVRIKDLALALDVDFDTKQISGSATYDLDWVDPEATQLVLDTRDLTIEKVVGERSDDKWIDLKYELADADEQLGSKLTIEAPASFENEPGFLFDGIVLPDGEDGVSELAANAHVRDFITDQYRHCKPIMFIGASTALMDQAGISHTLPDGSQDPGIVVTKKSGGGLEAFLKALAAHRHPERETDPPAV